MIDTHIDVAAILSRSNARPGVIDGVNYARKSQQLADAQLADKVASEYDTRIRDERTARDQGRIMDLVRSCAGPVSARWITQCSELGRACVYDHLRSLVARGELNQIRSDRNSRGYSHLTFFVRDK